MPLLRGDDDKPSTFVSNLPVILYDALCSATMLVVNKVAVHQTQAPTFLLVCQMAITAAVVLLMDAFSIVQSERLPKRRLNVRLP